MKKKVKIGVAGCGLISQIMHIPNLLEMREEFEITSLCDLSVGIHLKLYLRNLM